LFLQVDPYSSAERRVLVRDADDCTRLHIVSTAPDGSSVDEATITSTLTELGAGLPADGPGRLRIDITWLEARARASGVSAGWRDRFAAMLVYSRRHGWLDDHSGTLSVHIERQPESPPNLRQPVSAPKNRVGRTSGD